MPPEKEKHKKEGNVNINCIEFYFRYKRRGKEKGPLQLQHTYARRTPLLEDALHKPRRAKERGE